MAKVHSWAKFISSVAYFLTSDLDTTVSYYTQVLGFSVIGYNYNGAEREFVRMEKDAVLITFQRCSNGNAPKPNHLFADGFMDSGMKVDVVDLIIHTTDVSAYQDLLRDRGAKILQEFHVDALHTLIIEECNGYRLMFYQSVHEDQNRERS